MALPPCGNEASRIGALRRFRILDTPSEPAYDDLTRLTAFICGTPIAFIGFMDTDRLWFKSRIGWDVPEVPREMSFCANTILQSDVLVVSDTLADQDGLAACPLATHGGIRFYAGASLVSSDGFSLGTLCAMDSIPRGLTPGQTDALRRLARQVVQLLEARLAATATIVSTDSFYRDGGSQDSVMKVQGVSFWRDISDQRRGLETLRRSEQRLQGIIGSAMDAIVTIDSNQCIIMFNKSAEDIFRCPASDALGQAIDKFIPERYRTIHREHMQQFAQTGVSTRSMYSPSQLLGLRADGEEFPIEATISQVEFEGEKFFTVILRDVGARVRMEAKLRHTQKMEAIGQLAGGMAHEFNNYLGVILGYSEILWEEAGENQRLRNHVMDMRTATQHAASLTRQLLAFTRKQAPEPQDVDLNQCIWETHKLLRRLVPANIDVVPALVPTTGRVRADLGELQQVLINLVVNARDAMPDGGKIFIETANVELDEEYICRHLDLQPGQYVHLTVSDTGTGMNAETRAHLFEPFYTTKEPGKGTGLGLSTVYGVIKNRGGHIGVDSLEGKGTTIRIYLPRVEENREAFGTGGSGAIIPSRSTNILVVEDETALRRLIAASLEKRHHKILAAKDGSEALELFRQHADEIQLVITDLMMPRMDGLALKRQIETLRPKVKFLFISGYAETVLEQQQTQVKGCAFLEKPFLPEELATMVNILLTGNAAA